MKAVGQFGDIGGQWAGEAALARSLAWPRVNARKQDMVARTNRTVACKCNQRTCQTLTLLVFLFLPVYICDGFLIVVSFSVFVCAQVSSVSFVELEMRRTLSCEKSLSLARLFLCLWAPVGSTLAINLRNKD